MRANVRELAKVLSNKEASAPWRLVNHIRSVVWAAILNALKNNEAFLSQAILYLTRVMNIVGIKLLIAAIAARDKPGSWQPGPTIP